jgi:diguanylate cyclase (GGDEF)-like protein/PAS domain S-box-containing protein
VEQSDFYRKLLEEMDEGVYFVDRDRQIEFWNRGAERITGYTREEVVGRSCKDNILNHVDDEGELLCGAACSVAKTIQDGEFRESEVFLHHKNGHRIPVRIRVSPVHDSDGNIIGAVEIFTDNAPWLEVRQRLQDLERMARLDHLTQLPNRRHMDDQLESRLAELKRFGWPFGILMLDIDHFKQVNDTYGHETGDDVLRMIGRTLVANARPFDMTGRWGGEEFLTVVRNVDAGILNMVAERYRVLIAQSFVPKEPEPLRVTVTIGATLATAEDDQQSLVERADGLLYKGKDLGRNVVVGDQR